MTAGMSLECPDFTRKLFQEMDRGRIEDGMDRVDAQAIEVIIAEPHERVVAEKAAHLSTVRAVEIQRRTPERGVPRCEIRPESAQIVSAWAKMIVDDIQQNRD